MTRWVFKGGTPLSVTTPSSPQCFSFAPHPLAIPPLPDTWPDHDQGSGPRFWGLPRLTTNMPGPKGGLDTQGGGGGVFGHTTVVAHQPHNVILLGLDTPHPVHVYQHQGVTLPHGIAGWSPTRGVGMDPMLNTCQGALCGLGLGCGLAPAPWMTIRWCGTEWEGVPR
jgi:hypothetical protein